MRVVQLSRNPTVGSSEVPPGDAAGASTRGTVKEHKILGLCLTTRVSTDKAPRPQGAKLRKRNPRDAALAAKKGAVDGAEPTPSIPGALEAAARYELPPLPSFGEPPTLETIANRRRELERLKDKIAKVDKRIAARLEAHPQAALAPSEEAPAPARRPIQLNGTEHMVTPAPTSKSRAQIGGNAAQASIVDIGETKLLRRQCMVETIQEARRQMERYQQGRDELIDALRGDQDPANRAKLQGFAEHIGTIRSAGAGIGWVRMFKNQPPLKEPAGPRLQAELDAAQAWLKANGPFMERFCGPAAFEEPLLNIDKTVLIRTFDEGVELLHKLHDAAWEEMLTAVNDEPSPQQRKQDISNFLSKEMSVIQRHWNTAKKKQVKEVLADSAKPLEGPALEDNQMRLHAESLATNGGIGMISAARNMSIALKDLVPKMQEAPGRKFQKAIDALHQWAAESADVLDEIQDRDTFKTTRRSPEQAKRMVQTIRRGVACAMAVQAAADAEAGNGKGFWSMDTLKGLVHLGGNSSNSAGGGKVKGNVLRKRTPPTFTGEVPKRGPDHEWRPASGHPSNASEVAYVQDHTSEVGTTSTRKTSSSTAVESAVTSDQLRRTTGFNDERPAPMSSATRDPGIPRTQLSFPLPPNAAAPDMPLTLEAAHMMVPERKSSVGATEKKKAADAYSVAEGGDEKVISSSPSGAPGYVFGKEYVQVAQLMVVTKATAKRPTDPKTLDELSRRSQSQVGGKGPAESARPSSSAKGPAQERPASRDVQAQKSNAAQKLRLSRMEELEQSMGTRLMSNTADSSHTAPQKSSLAPPPLWGSVPAPLTPIQEVNEPDSDKGPTTR